MPDLIARKRGTTTAAPEEPGVGSLQPTVETVAYAATINYDTSSQNTALQLTLTGNCTFNLTGGAVGYHLKLAVLQDGTGGRTITFNASGTPMALNVNPNGETIYYFQRGATGWILEPQSTRTAAGNILAFAIRVAAGGMFSLPLSGATSITVDWGDGTSNVITSSGSALRTHTYAAAGIYRINIIGTMNTWAALSAGDQPKVLGVTRVESTVMVQMTWQGCANLAYLPERIDAPAMTNLSFCFAECYGLGSIPPGLLQGCTALTNGSGMFRNCSGITESFPAPLLKNCTLLQNLNGMFENCGNISGAIPSNFLSGLTVLSNAGMLFRQCTRITQTWASLGTLLNNLTALTDASGMFLGCVNITGAIASTMFTGCTSLQNLSSFASGSGISGALPSGLFTGRTTLTNLSSMFSSTQLSGALPSGLFTGLANVTNASAMFYSISGSGLGALPSGLMAGLTGLTNASQMFRSCGVTSVPNSFFSTNSLVTTCFYIFQGNAMTTLGTTVFNGMPICANYDNFLTGTSLNAASVDNALVSIQAANIATGTRTISYSPITGNGHLDSARSGAALTAINALITAGWTRTGSY